MCLLGATTYKCVPQNTMHFTCMPQFHICRPGYGYKHPHINTHCTTTSYSVSMVLSEKAAVSGWGVYTGGGLLRRGGEEMWGGGGEVLESHSE